MVEAQTFSQVGSLKDVKETEGADAVNLADQLFASIRSPMAFQDAEATGSLSLANLAQQVTSLREQLRIGLRDLHGEQAALRRRAQSHDDVAARHGEKHAQLEARVMTIEHEQQAAARMSANAFESLSARLIEHGVELASWPPAPEVRAVLDRVEEASQTMSARVLTLELEQASTKTSAQNSLAQAGELHELLGKCQHGVDADRQAIQRTSSDVASLRGLLSQASEEGHASRRDLEELKRLFDQQSQLRQRDMDSTRNEINEVCQRGVDEFRQECHAQNRVWQLELDDLKCRLSQAIRDGEQNLKDIQTVVHMVEVHNESRPCEFCVNPRHWTERNLSVWLCEQGFPPTVGQAFESHLVNGQVAENLSEQDLLSIGISDDLLRRRALRELERLFEPFRDHGLKLNPIGKVAAGTRPVSLGQRRGLPRPHSARTRSSSRHSNVSVKAMVTCCDFSGGRRTSAPSAGSQELICGAMTAGQQAAQSLTRSTQLKPLRPASGSNCSVGQRNGQRCGTLHGASAEEEMFGLATRAVASASGDEQAVTLHDIEERCFNEHVSNVNQS